MYSYSYNGNYLTVYKNSTIVFNVSGEIALALLDELDQATILEEQEIMSRLDAASTMHYEQRMRKRLREEKETSASTYTKPTLPTIDNGVNTNEQDMVNAIATIRSDETIARRASSKREQAESATVSSTNDGDAVQVKADWLRQVRLMYSKAKSDAKRRGIVFELTLDYYIALAESTTHCPVFGCQLVYTRYGDGSGQVNNNKASLDRIDSSKGYTVGNVAFLSWQANRLKNDATLAQLQALVKYMESNATAS